MSSVKKTPCNGCRERKRKCSYEQPCARCYKFKLDCVYTVMTSPADIEYLQELEYMKQIELMQNEISTMEIEINRLKLSNYHTTAVKNHNWITEKSEYDYPSPISIQPTNQEDLMIHHNQQQRNRNKQKKTIAKHNSIEAILSKETKPWTLTVKNGNMSIETHIKSYDDLMIHFKGMISTCIYQESTTKLPFPFSITTTTTTTTTSSIHQPEQNSIGHVCNVFIWKKYGKSRFKSLTKYTPLLLHYDPVNPDHQIQSLDKIAKLTMRFIYTFFSCLHLRTIYIHVPSFIRLFMVDEYHIMESPAVMALCALICHQRCKHLTQIIPLESLNDYGAFYFEKARELISEQFDQVNLETFITFTFMSVFKVKLEDDIQAEKYLSIAERIYHILLPQYKQQQHDDIFILFTRVYRCLYHVRSIIQLHQLINQMFRTRATGPHIFQLLESSNDLDFDIQIATDDTPSEIESIHMKRYLFQLRGIIRESSQHIVANDLKTYVSQFGHQVEMAMRHWYRHMLPPKFQLDSLPLFEDTLSDIEFFMKLESNPSPVPLLITLSLYNEYLIMSKSYLPRKQYDGHLMNLSPEELLVKYKAIKKCDTIPHERTDHHWLKVIEKMRRYHVFDSQMNEDEYIKKLIEAVNPTKLEFRTLPFARTSVITAFNMVRMTQFLVSREYSCFLDLRWIMNVWEVLIRAARFKYQVDGGEVTLDRIRANLILCLKIIQDQLLLSRRDSSSTFVDALQQEFNQLF